MHLFPNPWEHSFSELLALAHNDPLIQHLCQVFAKPDGPNEAGERLRVLSIFRCWTFSFPLSTSFFQQLERICQNPANTIVT
jgi:hypothetical protein